METVTYWELLALEIKGKANRTQVAVSQREFIIWPDADSPDTTETVCEIFIALTKT